MTALTNYRASLVGPRKLDVRGLTVEELESAIDATCRVAAADEVWWCETHNHEGVRQDPAEIPDAGECWQQVWGEYDDDNWSCQMVRRLLLKPEVKS